MKIEKGLIKIFKKIVRKKSFKIFILIPVP